MSNTKVINHSSAGFGYPWTAYRIEHRPTYGPHTKEELLDILNQLAAAGVKAWWYSVSTKGSYPMFPSKYLPYRDDAVDYLPWLVEEAHQRGIALFSWEYLTTAPLLGETKAEWRWKFFDWNGTPEERENHCLCWNSPYGDLLQKYCAEVVGELGFDGIWFDGAFLYGHVVKRPEAFACCCDFCAAKYRRHTGRELPKVIDLREEKVREYLEWRYFDHTEYWRALSAYVRERVPRAIIVFNFFNRIGSGIKSGSPLRRMANDAPQWPETSPLGSMEGMISAEVGHWPQQTILLAKILRAVNDNYPVELWAYGRDTVGVSTPNPDPGPMLLHAWQCAVAGAFPSIGMGQLSECRQVFPVLTANLDPLAKYIPASPVKTVGLVISGCSKDYGYLDDNHPLGQEGPAWNAAVGMHNLLSSARLPSEVLLDNMLIDSFIKDFPAVILPEVRCLSKASGAALERYVEQGGTLLAVGDTAVYDELGRPHISGGLLDKLFGISWRDSRQSATDSRFVPELTGEFDENSGRYFHGLPPVYQMPGQMRLVRSDSAEVLAAASYNPQSGKVHTAQGLKPPAAERVEGASILRRRVGKGQAILVAPNIAEAYGRTGPNRYSRILVERLLEHIERPFTAEAPPNVTISMFHQDNRVILHVLNVPDCLLTLGMGSDHHVWPNQLAPQDCVPTGPIRIIIPRSLQKVHSPTRTNLQCEESEAGGKTIITISRLENYAMIVFELSE